MKRLEKKIAVITGAGSGIGKATTELFSQEGALVVLVDKQINQANRVASEIRKNGGYALSICADVTSLEECKKVFATTIEEFGRVDILVNNAGILDYNNCVLKTSDELWNQTLAVNQTGPFYFCREALHYMEQQKSGSIVNVSSLAGITANAGASYTASKYAVIALTKNIALQYAGSDIRCNAVCPGRTSTPMNSRAEYFKLMDHDMMEICGRHIDNTVGKAEAIDQAYAILFFASDEARYVTGQWIVVDRGASCK